jgi:hypothetical protein
MSAPAQPEGKSTSAAPRPQRKAPRHQPYRRTSAIVNERPDGKPVIFGYGRHLTKREKERVQHLMAYGALGVVVAASVVIIAVVAIYSNFIYPNQAVAWVNGQGISRHDRSVMTNYYTAAEALQSQQGGQSLGDPQSLAVAQLQKSLLTKVSAQQQFGLTASKADAQALLNSQLASGGTSASTFNTNLHNYNIGKDDYLRLIIGPQVLEQKVGAHLTQGDPKVADQWHYARISVTTQKKGESVLQQLLHGASFAALAKKQSQDSQTASNGGDMGWVRPVDSADPLLASTFLPHLQAMQKSHAKYQLVKYSSSVWYVIELLGHDTKHPLSTSQKKQDQTVAFNNWFQPFENKARFVPALPANQLNTGGSSVTSGQTTGQPQTGTTK